MDSVKFNASLLWLSPIVQESTNKRFIHKINYTNDQNLVVETPVLKILDMQLIFEEGETHKILVRANLNVDNIHFRKIVLSIDKRILQESSFQGKRRFLPSYDYSGVFSFFIPIYKNEVNVLVSENNNVLSLSSIKKGMLTRLTLLLSHVESVSDVFFPIWNIIQIKIVKS